MRTLFKGIVSGALVAASANAQSDLFDESETVEVLTNDGPATTETGGFETSTEGFATSTEGFATSTEGFATSTEGFATTTEGFETSTDGFETSTDGFETSTDGFETTTEVAEVVTVVPVVTYEAVFVTEGHTWDHTWEAEFSQRLQSLTAGLNKEVELKRLELENAIKSKEAFMVLVQSSEGGVNIDELAPTMKSINSAKITLNQAESDFQVVFDEQKSAFEQLKTKTNSAKIEWESAQQTVVVATSNYESAKASYATLETEIAREEAAAKLLELQRAMKAAESLRLEYEASWASVGSYTTQMEAQLIQARTILFKEWSAAVQALRISTEASNKFQLDLVYQAESVVQQGLRQQQMLLQARKSADSAVTEADLEVKFAQDNLLRLQADGASQLTIEQARLAEMDLQAKDDAAKEALRLIAEQQTIQTQKLYDAEAEFKLARVAAEQAAYRVQEDLLVKAKLQRDVAKKAATDALRRMNLEVAKKGTVSFSSASSAERDAVQTQIVFLARQAEAAALKLKAAQAAASAADAAWTLKCREIRDAVRAQQARTRITVMLKITQGQEAAQIQAEAAAQAKYLRERIYQQALSKAELAEAGVQIQVDAMKQAYDLVSGQGYEADQLDQLQNASMTKSMWTEAYEKYTSSTAYNQTQDTKKVELTTAKAALLKFDAEVKALKLASETAKANLNAATKLRIASENMLDIQTEASTRLQIAEQNKRAEAEKLARSKAEQATERIQSAALERASGRSSSLYELEMQIKQTDEWSAQLKTDAQAAEIALAKREAELIQAEAKARARVDGEASILTSQAMEAATAAYSVSLRAESELNLKIKGTNARMALIVQQRAAVQVQLDGNQVKLAVQVQTSADSEEQWRIMARTRAGDMAAKIQREAESRSRARWQAKRFQILAISEAKKRAKLIREKAEEERTMTFYSTGSLYTQKFASAEEELAWKIEQQDKRIKHERLVKSSSSWQMQEAQLQRIELEAATSKQAVAKRTIDRTAAQIKHDNIQVRVKELEVEVAEDSDSDTVEDLASWKVAMEHANLELKLAVNAEKKAIVIAKATENAASVQGRAWCMAKQKTADAEWEALTKKQELQGIEGNIYVNTVYNQEDWRACLLQP